MKFENSNCDEIQTQTVTKLKNPNCYKTQTQIVTKFNNLITEIVPKVILWQNSNCEKTQNFKKKNSKT